MGDELAGAGVRRPDARHVTGRTRPRHRAQARSWMQGDGVGRGAHLLPVSRASGSRGRPPRPNECALIPTVGPVLHRSNLVDPRVRGELSVFQARALFVLRDHDPAHLQWRDLLGVRCHSRSSPRPGGTAHQAEGPTTRSDAGGGARLDSSPGAAPAVARRDPTHGTYAARRGHFAGS